MYSSEAFLCNRKISTQVFSEVILEEITHPILVAVIPDCRADERLRTRVIVCSGHYDTDVINVAVVRFALM